MNVVWKLSLNIPNRFFHYETAILSSIRFTGGKEDGKTLMQFLDGLKNEFKVRM